MVKYSPPPSGVLSERLYLTVDPSSRPNTDTNNLSKFLELLSNDLTFIIRTHYIGGLKLSDWPFSGEEHHCSS